MITVLAENNFGDNLPPGQAGPLGLFIIIVLGIACWFLYRSMSKHLRRLPTSFEEHGGQPPQELPRQRKEKHPAP